MNVENILLFMWNLTIIINVTAEMDFLNDDMKLKF